MTKQIETTIHINASSARVWEVLTDFGQYPQWNPFIQSLTGQVSVGNKIKIQLPGMTFKPVILTFSKNKELKWLGHFLFKGLFDGEHSFKLKEQEDGTVRFEQSECFNGILVNIFSEKLFTKTKIGFEQMNAKLKEQAEKKSG
jgi:hypothetical protein